MWLTEDNTPYVYWEGRWSPICGHCFWDNNYGATTFCKKLGHPSGSFERTSKTYPSNALKVGKCRSGEDLTACTEGCNDRYVGDGNDCSQGNTVGIKITCDGEGLNVTSCSGGNSSINRELLKH